jgi:hypothetical protein
MRPNNVSETHAESGDPLILDEAETGPLIPFKLVCAEIGIGRRTGGRRVPLRDSWIRSRTPRWPALRDNRRERTSRVFTPI